MKKLIFSILLIIMAIFLAGCTGNTVAEVGQNNLESDGDFMKIPVSEITNDLKKYSFNANGVEVKFFAVRSADGEIRTAFDACDVCGGYKGYKQEGNDVTCKKCGRSFKLQDIGTKNIGGGCWPSFLSHTTEGNEVLIKKSELAKGAFRFA